MKPLPRFGLPWRTLALAAAALAVAAAPGAASFLVLDRAGAAWAGLLRALPTHLVHFSPVHLLWDVGGLVATGAIFERVLGRRFWPVVLGSAASASAAFWFLVPDLDAYGGLSAVLHGMALAGATLAWRRDRATGARASAAIDVVWILAIVAKIAIEGLSGSPLFTDPATLGAVPLPLAHAAGALGAIVVLGPPRPGPSRGLRGRGGRDHSTILAPYNARMDLLSAVPTKPIVEPERFPGLDPLREHWREVRARSA